ncbi:MAG TPA: CPBP family intramembrane glutamic endopeptidase [Candidatus Deferrimicrobiaceae bacterium]|nr:CPBP family intramembrane glutamic endopeptidase [Candidatus Deferrimicrobiaceae bacterium]
MSELLGLIDELPPELRLLIGLALTGLLVMLRLEAERFGAAEYDEPIRGYRPPLLRRIAWYLLGVAGIGLLLFVHPNPQRDLFLAVGERSGLIVAFVLVGAGIAQALAQAWLHYRRLRLPDLTAYPGALANEIFTALIDEAVFRGAVLGYFLWASGGDATLSILGQAVMYGLATRLGAPGRDRYVFVLALVIGLVGGWATVQTGGIGAAFLGHAVTRVAMFLTTGHPGQPAPPGKEVEDFEKRRRTPDGWRVVERAGRER